jgi:hypothetical protein
MVRQVVGTRASYLVGPEREIRRRLRAAGLRVRASSWAHITPPPWLGYQLYRLAGDEHLASLRWRLPRVSWGQLGLELLPAPRRPAYGRRVECR